MARVNRSGAALLELLLILAVLALLAQSVPAVGEVLKQLGKAVLFYGDIRNYSWPAWGVLNFFLAVSLCIVRFWPEIKRFAVGRFIEYKRQKKVQATHQEKEQRKQALAEEREVLERLEQGRHKRIY